MPSSLADLEPGCTAQVRRVREQTPDLLHHLETLHLLPNAQVTVLERAPFGGPLRLRIQESTPLASRVEYEQSIGPQLASAILVARVAPAIRYRSNGEAPASREPQGSWPCVRWLRRIP
jgi:DtxR family Mn-dependent transcriptional regulator